MITADTYFFAAETILSANVTVGPPDAENQVYDAGTTYATNDEVWYDGHMFRSKVDANTGNTPVDGANWRDIGEVDQGAEAWASGTTYALADYAVYQGRIWKSAENSNTGNTPSATSTKWQDFGPTNRFRAFDLMFNRPAESLERIQWVFTMPQNINALVVMVPKGAFCRVTIKDIEDEEVYDEEQRVTLDSGGGPYNHDFSPIDTQGRLVFHGLPPGTGKEITVLITGGETGVVGCGQIAMGFAYDLGVTVTGSRVSVVNFVDPTENEFGIVSFNNRPIRRVAEFNIRNEIAQNDRTLIRASKAIQQPACVYMVDGVPYGLVAYGYATEIDLAMDNPTLSSGLIEIKGFAE